MSEEIKENCEKNVSFEDERRGSISVDVTETVTDPFCDEKNPRVISFQDVCQAAFMIRGTFPMRLE